MSPTLAALGKGLVIGFAIAAPVGAVGVHCIRTTLASGRRAGVAAGLGAATADAVYGSLAAFGVSAVTNSLVAAAFWLRLFGGVFLLYLGARTFLAATDGRTEAEGARGLVSGYAMTFAMTITNPMTILSFVAVFAGLGVVGGDGSAGWSLSALLVVGVFAGSSAWWVFLALAVGSARHLVDSTRLIWVNRISGSVIGVFGLVALWGLVR